MGSKNKKRLQRQAQRNAAAAAAAGVVIPGLVGAPNGQAAQIPNAQQTQPPNAQPTQTPTMATGFNAAQTSGLIPTPSSTPPSTNASVPVSAPAPIPISTPASLPLPTPAPLTAPLALSPRPSTTSQSSALGSIASSKTSSSAHPQTTATRMTLPAIPLSARGSTSLRPVASQAPSTTTSTAIETSANPSREPESEKLPEHSFELVLESPKPAAGTEGVELTVESNHFRCVYPDEVVIYQYDVQITPPPQTSSTPRKVRHVLQLFLETKFSNDPVATDYAQLVVSLKPLSKLEGTAESYTVDTGTDANPRRWTVNLLPNATLSLDELLKPSLPGQVFKDKQEIINALNLFTSHFPVQTKTHSLVGKDRYFSNHPPAVAVENLGGGLEAYFGFSKSMRPLQSGLFLQINTSCSALYRRVKVSQLLDQWTNISGEFNSVPKRLKQDKKYVQLAAFIRGLRVQADYGTRRLHSIWGFSTASNHPLARPTPDSVRFDQTDSRGVVTYHQTTVREYLQRTHREDSIVQEAHVINVGSSTHEVSVPCDRLNVLPGNAFKHLLDLSQTRTMVKFATKLPKLNKRAILASLKSFGIESNTTINVKTLFRLEISSEMLPIQARMLEQPWLQYKDQTFQPAKQRNWTLAGRQFTNVPKAPNCAWVELHDGTPAEQSELDTWLDALQEGLQQYCSTPNAQATLSDDSSIQSKKFPGKISELKNILTTAKRKYDILFVLLSSKDAQKYDLLKFVADYDVGLMTICTVKTQNRIKHDPDYIGNAMLKVNLKMGGVNTRIRPSDISSVSQLLSPSTMIVGADVTHPGPGSMEDAESIAAVVATYEETFSLYPASIRCQTGKREMIQHLDKMMEERLMTWSRLNRSTGATADDEGPLPTQIIFFRDGVSEGEFQQISEFELPLIDKAFKTVYGARGIASPKLLLICVVKRVNTRFFPVDEPGSAHVDSKGNALPGLVVDTDIVHRQGYDFYLQSQRAILGTAKPKHYIVLIDEIKVNPDVLQKAIFWQCWTFQRSLTPISVHPAARLADRACSRARSYMREFLVAGVGNDKKMDRDVNAKNAWKQGVHPDLADTMFYM